MPSVKALLPAFILTLSLSPFMAGPKQGDGLLAIERVSVGANGYYWSWPLFLAAFALGRAMVWMLED